MTFPTYLQRIYNVLPQPLLSLLNLPTHPISANLPSDSSFLYTTGSPPAPFFLNSSGVPIPLGGGKPGWQSLAGDITLQESDHEVTFDVTGDILVTLDDSPQETTISNFFIRDSSSVNYQAAGSATIVASNTQQSTPYSAVSALYNPNSNEWWLIGLLDEP